MSEAEADRVEESYQWAVTAAMNGVIEDVLADWKEGAPSPGDTSYGPWLRRVRNMVMLRVPWMRRLAESHYRLVRALRTGTTIAAPGEDQAPSLEDLRRQYEKVLDEVEAHAGRSGSDVFEDPEPSGDDPLEVDQEMDLEQFYDSTLEQIEEQVEQVLAELGPEEMRRKVEREEDAQEARDTAGRRVSAAAARITALAARGHQYNIMDADQKVIGWIRISSTGTPCGWCAMLLTRGFLDGAGRAMYRNKDSASSKQSDSKNWHSQDPRSVGEKFHDNCKCVAVPIFGLSQLDSPLFRLNRELADDWERLIRNNSSDEEALTTWRRHIRGRKTQEKEVAQEAA